MRVTWHEQATKRVYNFQHTMREMQNNIIVEIWIFCVGFFVWPNIFYLNDFPTATSIIAVIKEDCSLLFEKNFKSAWNPCQTLIILMVISKKISGYRALLCPLDGCTFDRISLKRPVLLQSSWRSVPQNITYLLLLVNKNSLLN